MGLLGLEPRKLLHAGADDDHGAVAEAQLADPLGDHIDKDLGVGDLGKGAMDKF